MTTSDRLGPRVRGVLRVFATLAALVALTTTGCSHESAVPDPAPRPSGADFSGVWYSPQFEHMYLRQNGNEVTGVYTYETGGRLEGTVEGNLLTFEWVEPGSKKRAVKRMSGHGYLQLVRRDGKLKLVGEWGYREDHRGGGPWRAEFIRKLEPTDPSNIREIRAAEED
ncbi:MAG: hypothetical protein ABEL76_05530 [Bradymonadaceae bacterium]